MAEETIYNSIHTGEQIDSAVAWLLKHAQDHICGGAVPGTIIAVPDNPTFWFAGAGSYTCGDDIITIPSGALGIISHNGEDWNETIFPVASDKADVINIGGMKRLKPNQAPIVYLQTTEQIDDTEGKPNNMWWSRDNGHLKYKSNGQIYDLGSTPPYMVYVCNADFKLYRWKGSSSGGGFAPFEMGGDYSDDIDYLQEQIDELAGGGVGGSAIAFDGVDTIIVGSSDVVPMIRTKPSTISFGDTQENNTATKNIVVTGRNLTSGISLVVSSNSKFSLSTSSINAANVNQENTIVITYSPTTIGNDTDTLTITSGSITKTIPLTGTCVEEIVPSITINDGNPISMSTVDGGTVTKSIDVVGRNLTPNSTINMEVSGDGLSISPSTLLVDENGNTSGQVTITYVAGSSDVTGLLSASCGDITADCAINASVLVPLEAGCYWYDNGNKFKYTVLAATSTLPTRLKITKGTVQASGVVTIPATASDEGKTVYDSNGNIISASGMTYPVTAIGAGGESSGAFETNGITKLTVEEGITTIGSRAFYNGNSYPVYLSEIVLPKTIKTWGTNSNASWALRSGTGTTYLKKLTIGGTTSWSRYITNASTLEYFELGEGVSNCNLDYAFEVKFATGAKIVCKMDFVPTLSANFFGNGSNAFTACALYVKDDLVASFKSAANWRKFQTAEQDPTNGTGMGIYGLSELQS